MTMPPDQARVIAGYEQLQTHVAGMRELAQAADWAALIAQQQRYLALVDRLKALDADVMLDGGAAARKAELLAVVLADDRAIREHLVARRDELGQLIGASRRQRDLNRSYGRQGGAVVGINERPGQDERPGKRVP